MKNHNYFPDSESFCFDRFPGVQVEFANIFARILEEQEINDVEALKLFSAEGIDLAYLIKVADELRYRAVGDIITYVTVRNINFTNVCYTGCRFCAFAKRIDDVDAQYLSLSEVSRRASEAWKSGATEVCMQGGLHPHMPAKHYRDLILAVKNVVPEMHVHAFSPFEIKYGAQLAQMTLPNFLCELQNAGLGSLPGTAAEILDINVRKQLTRDKLSTDEWINIVKTAHRMGIKTTSTIMYGHIDGPEHWVKHLKTIRDIQNDTGGFTEFVPLGFIHHNAPIYLDGTARSGPTIEENLRMHAISRIMLYGYIANIQVSWVKLGPALAQQCLRAGANDFGGTLMDETISKSAGAVHGQHMLPNEFKRLIRQIGRVPAQRDTLYELIEVQAN